jgi:hypothetical protein
MMGVLAFALWLLLEFFGIQPGCAVVLALDPAVNVRR